MTGNSPDPAVHEDQLNQVLLEYLDACQSGFPPDRNELLARYPELRTDLEEFFAGHDAVQRVSGSLREVPPAAAEPLLETFAGVPDIGLLGDFRLLRELGRGGMGVVYEAEQISLRRRVALKILPFVSALDNRQLQRFKTEAMAAAQLHHTNIVPVYAVGSERGVHFYAMQLIEGRSLAAVIRELRGDAADEPSHQSLEATAAFHSAVTQRDFPGSRSTIRTNRGRDSFRTAARIASQVADALEFAHEAGVIHRDIKPANLLLDGKGAIWITDFGLAQVVADVGLTQTGDLVGTLRYMSPEQASGRRVPVDHRADVYALGATLYELLTLQPIFTGSDRGTLLNQILNDEPKSPRKINRAIPIELETIVLKATAKSPADRYATAGQLAADLRRYLDDRPIHARRPTVLEHVRKWMRRHPGIVGGTLFLLACGMIGLSVTTAIISQEHVATKEALRKAEVRLTLARGAADEMIRLAEQEILAEGPFEERLRKQLLGTALDHYQKFIEQQGDEPAVQAELAVTRDRVDRILRDLALLQFSRHSFLLTVDDVLNDLEATPQQRQQLSDFNRTQKRPPPPFPGGHREPLSDDRRERMLDEAREQESALAAILTRTQLQRLHQIALQFEGPHALLDFDVAKKLSLSAEQKEEIREILLSGMRQFGGQFGPGPRPWERRDDDQIQEVFARSEREMLALLNSDQRAQWQSLTGKPYLGRKMLPGGFGDGPGGPPPGEPRRGPAPRRPQNPPNAAPPS